MTVHPVSQFEFEVKERGCVEIVNILEKKCSCRYVDLQQLPCAHALAVCRHVRLSYNSLCSHYYTTEVNVATYAKVIHPVGNDCDWVVPPELYEVNIKAPKQRPSIGRPRKQRIPSSGEEVVHRRCSHCLQLGHNRATCKNPVPLHPN